MKEYKWILVWIVVSLIFAFAIHCTFSIEAPIKSFEAVWSAGDILTYVSTISLGLLAFWQNQKLYKETNKDEIRNLAIEKYVLFIFEELEAKFYNNGDDLESLRKVKLIEEGFNGNKAFWKYDSIKKEKLNIKIKIKNIGDYPAVELLLADGKKENAKKVKDSNIIHSKEGINDSKYILNGNYGYLIINIKLKELYNKGELKYYLKFKNPFGFPYYQEITIKSSNSKKIIKVDAKSILEEYIRTRYDNK